MLKKKKATMKPIKNNQQPKLLSHSRVRKRMHILLQIPKMLRNSVISMNFQKDHKQTTGKIKIITSIILGIVPPISMATICVMHRSKWPMSKLSATASIKNLVVTAFHLISSQSSTKDGCKRVEIWLKF